MTVLDKQKADARAFLRQTRTGNGVLRHISPVLIVLLARRSYLFPDGGHRCTCMNHPNSAISQISIAQAYSRITSAIKDAQSRSECKIIAGGNFDSRWVM